MFSSSDTCLHQNHIIPLNSKCTIQWISNVIFNLKIRSATSFCSFLSIASFWRRTFEILFTLSILLSDVLNSLVAKDGKIIMMSQNLNTRAGCERLAPGVRRTRAQKRVPSIVSSPTRLQAIKVKVILRKFDQLRCSRQKKNSFFLFTRSLQIVHMNNKHITFPTNQEWCWKTPHLLCKWHFKVKPSRNKKM